MNGAVITPRQALEYEVRAMPMFIKRIIPSSILGPCFARLVNRKMRRYLKTIQDEVELEEMLAIRNPATGKFR